MQGARRGATGFAHGSAPSTPPTSPPTPPSWHTALGQRARLLVLLAARHARTSPGRLLGTLACGLVACLATATATLLAAGIEDGALREAVRTAAPDARSVRVDGAAPARLAAADQAVRATAAGVPGLTVTRLETSDTYTLPGADPRLRVYLGRSADDDADATLTSGRWPRSATDVAVPESAAARLGWRVGQTLRLQPLVPTQKAVPARTVTGIYRATDPAAPTWWDDPAHGGGLRDDDFLTAGPLLAPADLTTPLAPSAHVAWRAVAAPDLAADPTVINRLVSDLDAAPALDGLTVGSRLPQTLEQGRLDGRTASQRALAPTLLVLLLAVVAALVSGVALAQGTAATDRLLVVRGASPGQRAALTALPVALLAPGALLAALAAPALARLASPTSDGPHLGPWSGALLVSLSTAVVVGGAAVLAALAPTVGGRRGSVVGTASLVALAALAWQRFVGRTSTDVIDVVTPALVALATAFVAAALARRLVAAVAHAAGRRRGLPLAWAGWRAARSVVGDGRLLVTLVGVACTLGLVQLATGNAVVDEQARRRAPVPLVVTTENQVAAVPGATAAIADGIGKSWTPVWTASIITQGTRTSATLVAADSAAAVVRGAIGVRPVSGPQWPQALAALPSHAWAPDTQQGLPSPHDAIEVRIDRLPAHPPGLVLPPLEITLDDAAGRRYRGTIPPVTDPSPGRPTHRALLHDLVPAGGGDRLVLPLRITSFSMSAVVPWAGIGSATVTSRGTVRPAVPGRVVLELTDPDRPDAVLHAYAQRRKDDPLPVVVSRELAAAERLEPGSRLVLPLGRTEVSASVVAVVDGLPGADAGPALLADLTSLQQRTDVLAQEGARPAARSPLDTTTLWLDGPAAGADILRRRPGVRQVLTADQALADARGAPVAAGQSAVHLVLLLGAVLLALVAVSAAAATGAPSTRHGRAVLHALGTPAREVRRADAATRCLRVLTTLLPGVGCGLLVAPTVARRWFDAPAVVPWPWLLLGVGLLVALLLAAAALGESGRSRAHRDVLRGGGPA